MIAQSARQIPLQHDQGKDLCTVLLIFVDTVSVSLAKHVHVHVHVHVILFQAKQINQT
jgi:hypothetical protein